VDMWDEKKDVKPSVKKGQIGS